MNESNGQARGKWRSNVMQTVMAVKRVFVSLDAFLVFLLLVLIGTWIQHLVDP